MFLTVLPVLHIEQQAGIFTIVLQPLYQLGVSLVIAWLLARLMLWAARHLGQSENVQFALTAGTIIGAIGLSKMLNVSPLLALLGLGILANVLDREQQLLQVDFGFGGELFFLILFVVAGANLHLEELGKSGLLAVLFVIVRQIAKSSATYGMLRAGGMDARAAAMAGLTLTPMAGLAIGLSQLTYDLYPQFGQELRTLVLASIAILETFGPVATEYALKRAGEVQGDTRLNH
jgi:Kef-type K+ transport system membrane component KefB